jgi:glutamine synthetase
MHDLESLYENYHASKSLLQNIISDFVQKLTYVPLIGIELEFFVENADNTPSKSLLEIISSIKLIALNKGLGVLDIKQEEASFQYEVNFAASKDLLELAESILIIKGIIVSVLAKHKLQASFVAKPYKDKMVGSGMHVNISLLSPKGQNIYAGSKIVENDLLLSSIAGLLHFLPASVAFFVTSNQDFSRFRAKIELEKSQIRYQCNNSNAPINISWGINNRTTALRVVNLDQDDASRRIEHRVPAANANPYLVFIAILKAIEYGVIKQLKAPKNIWGNAFDPQYNLPPLPINIADSLQYYEEFKPL